MPKRLTKSEINQRYYEANKESILAERKAYYTANKERIKAYNKAYAQRVKLLKTRKGEQTTVKTDSPKPPKPTGDTKAYQKDYQEYRKWKKLWENK